MAKTKRKIIAVAAVAICLAFGIAGSVAYFTGSSVARNVIEMAPGVTIEVVEWTQNDDGTMSEFVDVEGVMPGSTVSKIAEVKSEDESSEAWVRVKVDKSIQLADGVEGTPDLSLVTLDFNTDAWTDGGDGWWYCNDSLLGGATTKPLFNTVTFANSMGNMYKNSTATVSIKAQAVQVANNGNSALEAAGWPDSAGN